jgi:hypothetical protein
MKGKMLRCCLAAIALWVAAQAAFALEFGLDAETSNLFIPWSQQTPIADSSFPTTNYFWGGEAWMVAPLGDEALVRISYDRDPILRNTAIAAVQFERGIARISVGPLFGFLNSDSSPFSAGISAAVRLQWPGVAYVSLRSDGGTAISIFQSSTDPQAQTELAAGFYVPNAIVSGVFSAKRFNELDSGGQLLTDSVTRYAMTVDVFKKNVPYNTLLSIGYELRSKRYAASSTTDSLGAVVLGIDATAQIDRAFGLKAGISTGAYVFGMDALQNRSPGSSAFIFSANIGLSIDTAKILPAAPKLPPAASEEKPETAVAAASPSDATPKPEATPAEASPPDAAQAAPAPEAPPQEAVPAPEKAKPADFSRLALDAGAGVYYDDRIQLTGAFAILGALFNVRGGLWGSIGYRLSPSFALGGEVGLDYLPLSASVGTTSIDITFYDIPVLAKVSYSLGKFGLEGFAGAFINGVTSGTMTVTTVPSIDLNAGARVRLGGIYAEASYVISLGSQSIDLGSFGSIATNYPRFGLGYSIKFM